MGELTPIEQAIVELIRATQAFERRATGAGAVRERRAISAILRLNGFVRSSASVAARRVQKEV